MHATHTFDELHKGVDPLHCDESIHATHSPDVVLQYWVAPLGHDSVDEHATHAFVVVSQMGVDPLHCVLSVHATHAPEVVLQN